MKPKLVVEVEYTERTRDGLLRHPSFLGVREDLEPEQIESPGANLEEAAPASATRSTRARTAGAVEVAGIELTHPERILYPEQGVTKLALARYYESIHEWVLPYLARRPLVLLRCPEGRQACFYQKHLGKSQARSVPRIAIEEKGAVRDYVYVRSLADILALVQHGVLEFHAWGCQVEDIEHPDLLVFDLDPAPEVAWKEVLRTARELRDRLQELGLTAFPRTTGGKGLHLVVPLQPEGGLGHGQGLCPGGGGTACAGRAAPAHHQHGHVETPRQDLSRLSAQHARLDRHRLLLGPRPPRCAGGSAAALG